MTVLAYDRVWVEEPNLLLPGKKPLRRMTVDRQNILGRTLQAFVMPQSNITKSDVVLTGATQEISGATLGVQGGIVAATLSSGYIRNLTIPAVSLPFTLASRFMPTTTSTSQRILHVTKGTSFDTISGFFVTSVTGLLTGQHYDGTNDLTTGQAFSPNVWHTVVCVFSGTTITLDVNGVVTTGTMSWTAGPDRLCFGNADWSGALAFAGHVEWYGLWFEDMSVASRAELRRDSYQMLVPA